MNDLTEEERKQRITEIRTELNAIDPARDIDNQWFKLRMELAELDTQTNSDKLALMEEYKTELETLSPVRDKKKWNRLTREIAMLMVEMEQQLITGHDGGFVCAGNGRREWVSVASSPDKTQLALSINHALTPEAPTILDKKSARGLRDYLNSLNLDD